MDLESAVYDRDLIATKRLLVAGADPNIINHVGHPLIFFPIIDVLRDNSEMVELLLNFKANPEIESDTGDTPLAIASRFGSLKIMKLLLARKVDVNHQDKYGNTALLGALSNGHLKATELLLEHGAKIDIFNEDRKFPLHIASDRQSYILIKILLEHGASPNVRDNKGKTPKEYVNFDKSMTPDQYINNIMLFNAYDLSITKPSKKY